MADEAGASLEAGTAFWLVEPWVDFLGVQTEPEWSPISTIAQVFLWAASCFHRGPSTWHEFLSAPSPCQLSPRPVSQNPSEVLIELSECMHTCAYMRAYTHTHTGQDRRTHCTLSHTHTSTDADSHTPLLHTGHTETSTSTGI